MVTAPSSCMTPTTSRLDLHSHLRRAVAALAESGRWIRRGLSDVAAPVHASPKAPDTSSEYGHAARVDEDLT